MSERNKLIRQLIGWIVIAIGAGISFALQVLNPDMTHMRLLIAFWPYWLIVVAAAFIGIFLVREE